MPRGEYVSSKKQEAAPSSATLDLRSNPQAPVEVLRDEAVKIAQYQSMSPKTRGVIATLLSSDGWTAPSFNSVDEANAETRAKESVYIAYFEKGTSRLLFEWDRRRPGGVEPSSWWPQVDYQTTGIALGFGVLLGLVLGSRFSLHSPVHRRR